MPARLDVVPATQYAEQWPRWITRFERYRIASGLKGKSGNDQVSTMLYSMGDCADDILTMSIDETKSSYEELVNTFNEHFQSRKNTIAERAKFNKRVQRPGEPVDLFIQDLYKLADDCDPKKTN